MKKSILSVLCAALVALSFAGCASISESGEQTDSLLYGNIVFNFKCYPNNHGFPENDSKTNGIEIQIENLKTKKTYFINSKSNGEILRQKLPEGVYRIKKIQRGFKVVNGWADDIVIDFGNNDYRFAINANTVTNLGQIDVNIEIVNIDVTEFTCRSSYYLNKDFSKAYNTYAGNHLESSWLDAEWLSPEESFKRYGEANN